MCYRFVGCGSRFELQEYVCLCIKVYAVDVYEAKAFFEETTSLFYLLIPSVKDSFFLCIITNDSKKQKCSKTPTSKNRGLIHFMNDLNFP